MSNHTSKVKVNYNYLGNLTRANVKTKMFVHELINEQNNIVACFCCTRV